MINFEKIKLFCNRRTTCENCPIKTHCFNLTGSIAPYGWDLDEIKEMLFIIEQENEHD